MSDATPILPFISDVMNSLAPYWLTGLAVVLGMGFIRWMVDTIRGGADRLPRL